MIHRIIGNLAIVGIFLMALACAAKFAHAQHTHGKHDWHPEWLQKTGCCGPQDCYRLRVKYTPLGWQIIAMRLKPADPWMPPPATIIVPLEVVSASRDGHFWGCFRLGSDGRPTKVFYTYWDGRTRLCFFQPNGGG